MIIRKIFARFIYGKGAQKAKANDIQLNSTNMLLAEWCWGSGISYMLRVHAFDSCNWKLFSFIYLCILNIMCIFISYLVPIGQAFIT